ncbi:hypothetical protein ACVWW9_001109 [Agrococcus sp. UYP33]
MDFLMYLMTGNPRALIMAIPNLLAFIAVIVVVVIALRALLRIDRSLQELVARGRDAEPAPSAAPAPPAA